MKKFLCVAAAFIAVVVLYLSLRNTAVQFPYVYVDNTPSAVSVSYPMPLNFKLFRESINEMVSVKVYSGKSSDGVEGKEPIAVFDEKYEQKGNTIEYARFTWDTPDVPGDYFAEYYSSRLIGGEWKSSPEKMYVDFSVIYPCNEHTFEENEDSIYGTEGVSSDCYTKGTAYRLCTVCSYEETYELDFSHTYGGATTISSASCRDNGYKAYKCTKCSETKVEVIEADTDKHRISAVIKIEPTATRPGSVWFECSRCNYVEPYQTEIPALFMDINPTLYYEKPVAWAYDNDYFSLIKGYEFDPDKDCDRAKAVSLMYVSNSFGVTAEDANPFDDVKDGDYFKDAAKWAYKYRIIDGGSFRPYEACTRAEIIEMLWRLQGSPVVRFEHNFIDIPEDASYSEAVSWAVSEDIASGMEEGLFEPDRKCSEAQVITFLYRVLNEDAVKDDGNIFIG